MFTGIIEKTGTVEKVGQRLIINTSFDAPVLGESIAVDGVCLTLAEVTEDKYHFDVSPETLSVTTLGRLKVGESVHLERALRLQDRVGGHFVTGHVDTTANITKLNTIEQCLEVTLSGFNPQDMRYFAPKGSVAVNGVSLTINAVTKDAIELMLIPHTLEKTTFSSLKTGQEVNIEYDYLARMVVHQLGSWQDSFIIAHPKRSDVNKEVYL